MEAHTKLLSVASAANSECHLTGIQSTVDSIMQELDIKSEELTNQPKLSVGYGEKSMTVYITAEYEYHDEKRYEFVTGHPDSTIWNTKTIDLRQTRYISCLPQDVDVTIHIRIEIPLPEEDLLTLRQLGKVTTEVSSPSISESVSCTF